MSQKILLVEGKDDQNVVWAFCNAYELPQDFKVRENGGKGVLLQSLQRYLLDPLAYPVLGILVDADDSLKSTWEAIATRLQDAGYSVPLHPGAEGTILEHPNDGPRLGIWLMPDNHLAGKLEDFVRLLIPKGDGLTPEAESALRAIEGKGVQRYAAKDRPKAFIHTWLAWQKDPGAPMGLAITKRYLDPNSPQADSFVAWLCRLFLEE